MNTTQRAKAIDLGDGTLCCDRATGEMCHEHEQIKRAMDAAIREAIKELQAKLEAAERKHGFGCECMSCKHAACRLRVMERIDFLTCEGSARRRSEHWWRCRSCTGCTCAPKSVRW